MKREYSIPERYSRQLVRNLDLIFQNPNMYGINDIITIFQKNGSITTLKDEEYSVELKISSSNNLVKITASSDQRDENQMLLSIIKLYRLNEITGEKVA